MAVGDDEQIEPSSFAALGLQFPSPAAETLGVHDAVGELDALEQAERFGVGVEVLLDLGVVREVRELVGHREVAERQLMLGGVDVQRAVGTAVPLGLPNAQLPPIRSELSKQVYGTP